MTTREDSENFKDRNAREEFEEVFESIKISCARLVFRNGNGGKDEVFLLRNCYTLEEYEEFLSRIDRTYNPSGYADVLRGTVVTNNDSWYERVNVIGTGVFSWIKLTAPEGCENTTTTKSSGKR